MTSTMSNNTIEEEGFETPMQSELTADAGQDNEKLLNDLQAARLAKEEAGTSVVQQAAEVSAVGCAVADARYEASGKVSPEELQKTNTYESRYMLSHFQRVVHKSRSIKPADLMELEEIERGLSEVSTLCRHVTNVGVEPKA